ncbi:MAG: acyl-CoA dehydrogenase family protein [Rhodospirillaceae bacterium]|nr:acyl-CoA dehydrogenase family protein [Rhodospirillaceae bacterium]
MNFAPTEEQVMFRDSVRRFVADEYPFDKRLKIVAEAPGYRPEHWKAFADLGWLSVPFAEEYGGLGGDPFDLMVLMEEFGRALLVSPYLSTVVLSGRLLQEAGGDTASSLIAGIVAGDVQIASALAEAQGRYDLFDVATKAEHRDGSWHISGRKLGVPFATTADRLIVSARTAGGRRDRTGITLFLVDSDAGGVTRSSYRTHDGGSAATVDFDHVAVDAVLGERDGAWSSIELVSDIVSAALAAEMTGAMWAAQEQTVEYAKTRKQFDQTLGHFQALQHRMVDMFMKCELARSMTIEATNGAGMNDPAERTRRIAAARSLIGRYARHVGEEAIQIHGGVGVTMELPIGHYLKRVMAINATLGDPDYHRRRYIRLMRGEDNVASVVRV